MPPHPSGDRTLSQPIQRRVVTRDVVHAALAVMVMLLAVARFGDANIMAPAWTYPYFSGAEHLDRTLSVRCSQSGYEQFRALPHAAQLDYDFSAESDTDLIDCSYNDFGYVLVVVAAKTLLPFLTSIRATVALQCMVHVAITLVLMFSFQSARSRALFVLGYGANPLVVQLTAFAFYYFWQVIPSFVFVLVLQNRRRPKTFYVLAQLSLLLSYLIRPSTLPFVLFVSAFPLCSADRRMRGFHAALASVVAVTIGCSVFMGRTAHKEVWHTAYVGLGAYPNPFVRGLSDGNGFRFYRETTGVRIDTGLTGNFNQETVRHDYYRVIRNQYLDIVRSSPWLVIKNALRNITMSFSFGYIEGGPVARFATPSLSLVVGLAIILLLLATREFSIGAAILISSIGFTPYFPPITRYMFGAYLLLVVACIRALRAVGAARWGRA